MDFSCVFFLAVSKNRLLTLSFEWLWNYGSFFFFVFILQLLFKAFAFHDVPSDIRSLSIVLFHSIKAFSC